MGGIRNIQNSKIRVKQLNIAVVFSLDGFVAELFMDSTNFLIIEREH